MRAGVPVARIPQSLLRCVSATKLTQENKRPRETLTKLEKEQEPVSPQVASRQERLLFHSQPTAPVEKRLSAAVRRNVRIRNPIDGYGFKC